MVQTPVVIYKSRAQGAAFCWTLKIEQCE